MTCPFAVIIPSRTLSNLGPCVAALQTQEPHLPGIQVIVVDDDESHKIDKFCDRNLLTCVKGEKPFIFSRAINTGIRAAREETPDLDGFVLLNDDALLQTHQGFTRLHQASVENPQLGVIASTCSNVGNPNQRPHGVGLRIERRMVCFVSVYISSFTIQKVGFLDESMIGYGFEDDDYCLRVRSAGLGIGIHDGCFTDHGSLVSTFRGDPRTPATLDQNAAIYRAKWGEDNWGNK